MWLSKNERKLLRIIYTAVKAKTETNHTELLSEYPYPVQCLIDTFQSKHFEKDANTLLAKSERSPNTTHGNNSCEKLKSFFYTIGDIECTLNLIKEQNLIDWKRDGDFKISMTYKGFRLGQNYSDWFTRTNLCFAEYKDHWLCLIISFLGGIISSIIVYCISKLL